MWWWVVDACTLFTTPITVSARTCQQWQVPHWPWILRTRRVESSITTYGLYDVAANGLTVCVCVIYMYVCKLVVECGWRWDNKTFHYIYSPTRIYWLTHNLRSMRCNLTEQSQYLIAQVMIAYSKFTRRKKKTKCRLVARRIAFLNCKHQMKSKSANPCRHEIARSTQELLL
jgi:hypothetical protein